MVVFGAEDTSSPKLRLTLRNCGMDCRENNKAILLPRAVCKICAKFGYANGANSSRMTLTIGRCEHRPMVSVILDEFAPFAYPNFAQILQTARGSNIALLFSLQSIPQLRNVSRSFGDDVSSAPNTTMLLRTRDEETVRYFLNASARVTGERRTMTVEKRGVLEERYREIGFGSITEIEKTRAVDYHIKNLPVGQMQVLTTDNQIGTLHKHVHVRRAERYRLRSLEPIIYPRMGPVTSCTRGANLQFKNADLARPMYRIFGKSRPA